MLELKIYNPSEDGFVKSIDWNFEELKAEITEKASEYKSMVYTSDEQVKKEGKADRAKLRKFIDGIEAERKRIKKQCMEPYTTFESQIKELVLIVDEAVQNIDTKVKAYEDKQREEKRNKIMGIYEEIVPEELKHLLPFEIALVDKYLNTSTSLKAVRDGIQNLVDKTKSDIEIIEKLPDFVFEAMEKYHQTLDLNWSLNVANNLREQEERKKIFEEQRRNTVEKAILPDNQAIPILQDQQIEPVYMVGLKIHGTKKELDLFCKFLNDNKIRYDVTEKPKRED